jgi:capsule polysaccharide export protein KpsE/RkpR
MKNLLDKFKQLSLFKQIIIVLVVLTIVIVKFDLFKNLVYIGLVVGAIYLFFLVI